MKQLVIFGGSGGLGRQLKHLLKDKYEVTALSSDDCDVSNFNEVNAFFANRKIDIVLNFAGLNFDRFIHKVEAVDLPLLTDMLSVNINGAINIAANVLPGMRERRYGRLIFASSVLATKDVVGTGVYASCKAFIDRFVKSISAENARCGVTANSLQLGYFDGGLTYKLPYQDNIKETIPSKRWGTIEELHNAVEFLINTEYCTGANLKLDGGCF